tara:strand:- start:6132 stop:6902 length:771 start_codon:yes stop_codon:yes gene_type:complete
MKLIRYKNLINKSISNGILEVDKIFPLLNDPFSKNLQINYDEAIPFDSRLIEAPCLPTKIIALAINYKGSTGITSSMSEPLVFLKSTNAVSSFNQPVRLPFTSNTWGEAELGVVIGKTTSSKIPISDVKSYILGYLAANDVSCDNVDNRDHHLARSKSADGFCPLGQYIDTDYDFHNKEITAYHNDILLRKGNTNEMIWNPEKIVIWLSNWMTLYPGDIIITGTPSRVRDRKFLKNGDTFTVKIEGLPDLLTSFYE